jgi:hypothetical protein
MMTFIGPRLRKPLLSGVAEMGSPMALSDRIRRRREVTEVGVDVALDEQAWWPACRGARRPERGDGP